MKPIFYDDSAYKKQQAEVVRLAWRDGVYKNLVLPLEDRNCANPKCSNIFSTKPYDPKKFCSRNCAATVNNTNRVQSYKTRAKISKALLNSTTGRKGIILVPRDILTCQNCKKEFQVYHYKAKTRKFCSNICAMKVIGGKTTSAKASRGKSGIREDISPSICFYSTWEANMARIFSLLKIKWEYAPKIFQLRGHTYRPDFYLPDFDAYIEVKNYMNEYSDKRDRLFRSLYPEIELYIISKKEYLDMKESFKKFINKWE